MEKQYPVTRINVDAILLLNQKNILKAKRITTLVIDEVKEYIILKIWSNTDDHTKGMNDDKKDTNDEDHQKGRQESYNNDLGKIENHKHPGEKVEQHAVRNKLKEDLQITVA
jgi:heme-degrading monooxygenase HmoA